MLDGLLVEAGRPATGFLEQGASGRGAFGILLGRERQTALDSRALDSFEFDAEPLRQRGGCEQDPEKSLRQHAGTGLAHSRITLAASPERMASKPLSNSV